jgi:hypothetical protein
MRGVSAFVLAALAACSVGAQAARENQPSASTQVEEIYVVRSVFESSGPPTVFCAQDRIGFAGATGEMRWSLRSTATQASDGRMIDTNVETVGSLHGCSDTPSDRPYNTYAEVTLGSTTFKGRGVCLRRRPDFPERGMRVVSCSVDLSGLPSDYVGGLLTTNTMVSRKIQGLETDPPGYTQMSIATIRLWRKRDAPPSAVSVRDQDASMTKDSLVGTWKLVSATETNERGEIRDSYGPTPVGFLTYTADGRVSVVIADSRRKPLSAVPPPTEEMPDAFSAFVAYAGTYTFADDRVTHHIEVAWVQNFANTDQVRPVKLEGDRLMLRKQGFLRGGVQVAYQELVWERLKPQATKK